MPKTKAEKLEGTRRIIRKEINNPENSKKRRNAIVKKIKPGSKNESKVHAEDSKTWPVGDMVGAGRRAKIRQIADSF